MNDQDQTNPAQQATTSTSSPDSAPVPELQSQPKRSRMWIAVVLVLVVAAAAGAWWYMKSHAKTPVVQRTVKIGLMTPQGGVFTNAGTSIKEGVEFAKKQLSAEGLTVSLSIKDTGCDPAKTVQAVKDLAAEGVVAIIGETCSGATIPAVPVAAEKKIPMISASATNPKLSGLSPYFFRTIPSDAFSSDFTAKLIYGKSLRKLALIHSDEPYGNGISTAVSDSFKKAGGTVVANEPYVNESTNVTAQMDRIFASKPDAIYLATTSATTLTAILQKYKALKMTAPIFGSENLKDQTIIDDTKTLSEGLTVIAVSDGTPDYVEQVRGAYGHAPGVYNAQAYDAYRVIFEALKTGAASGEQIAAAMRNVSFDGASGHIKFDSKGDIAPNFTAFKVVEGKFKAQN